MATTKYDAPDFMTRNLFNPIVALFTKMGLSMRGSRMLAVRGRKSGEWRTTPVNLLHLNEQRYLVAPRGGPACRRWQVLADAQVDRAVGAEETEDPAGGADRGGQEADAPEAPREARRAAADGSSGEDAERREGPERRLDRAHERPERPRVDEQVHRSAMEECVRSEPVPVALRNRRRGERAEAERGEGLPIGFAQGELRSEPGSQEREEQHRARQPHLFSRASLERPAGIGTG